MIFDYLGFLTLGRFVTIRPFLNQRSFWQSKFDTIKRIWLVLIIRVLLTYRPFLTIRCLRLQSLSKNPNIHLWNPKISGIQPINLFDLFWLKTVELSTMIEFLKVAVRPKVIKWSKMINQCTSRTIRPLILIFWIPPNERVFCDHFDDFLRPCRPL